VAQEISQQKDNLDTKTKAKEGYKLPNKMVAWSDSHIRFASPGLGYINLN